MTARTLTIFLICALITSGCKRDDDNPTPAPVAPSADTAVAVSGIRDIDVPRGRLATLALNVTGIGEDDTVALSVVGLPPNVFADISPDSNGTPFHTTLALTAGPSAIFGDSSEATVFARNSSGVEKSYSFKVRVVAPPDCAADIAGDYYGSFYWPNTGVVGPFKLFPDPASPQTRIAFRYFAGILDTAFANLHCSLNSFTIPYQEVGNKRITGGGTYTNRTVTLNYLMFSPDSSSPVQCTGSLSR